MEKIDWSAVKPKLNPKNNLPTILITEPDQNGNQQLISNEQGDKHREISPTNQKQNRNFVDRAQAVMQSMDNLQ